MKAVVNYWDVRRRIRDVISYAKVGFELSHWINDLPKTSLDYLLNNLFIGYDTRFTYKDYQEDGTICLIKFDDKFSYEFNILLNLKMAVDCDTADIVKSSILLKICEQTLHDQDLSTFGQFLDSLTSEEYDFFLNHELTDIKMS